MSRLGGDDQVRKFAIRRMYNSWNLDQPFGSIKCNPSQRPLSLSNPRPTLGEERFPRSAYIRLQGFICKCLRQFGADMLRVHLTVQLPSQCRGF